MASVIGLHALAARRPKRTLRRAHKQSVLDIRERISRGLFNFEDEFPDYRFKAALPAPEGKKVETCYDVFDRFLAHWEMRVSMDDMAFSTLDKAIARSFRRKCSGPRSAKSRSIRLSIRNWPRLFPTIRKAERKRPSTTYPAPCERRSSSVTRIGLENSIRSPRPLQNVPRITQKDRPRIDPFTIQEAEAIIAAAHRIHGEWYGNYEEFRFFTGLRQSEQFALEVGDCDLETGAISITKAVVLTRKKNRTKTNQDREISPSAARAHGGVAEAAGVSGNNLARRRQDSD